MYFSQKKNKKHPSIVVPGALHYTTGQLVKKVTIACTAHVHHVKLKCC